MHFTAIDSATVTITKTTRVDNGLFGAWKWRNPLQAKFGPEGALYVLNYDGWYSTIDPGVARVDYIGPCKPAVQINSRKADPKIDFDISLTSSMLRVRESGKHTFGIFTLSGQAVYEVSGKPGAEYRLRDLGRALNLKTGLYTIRVATLRGAYTRIVALL